MRLCTYTHLSCVHSHTGYVGGLFGVPPYDISNKSCVPAHMLLTCDLLHVFMVTGYVGGLFGAPPYDINNERADDIPFQEQLQGIENVIKQGKVRGRRIEAQ